MGNVILQVLLTVIAGSHIVSANYSFKESLMGFDNLPNSPYIWLGRKFSQEADDLGNQGVAVMPNQTWDMVDQAYKMAGVQEDEQGGDPHCCNSASCSNLGLPCCERAFANS